MFKQLFLHTRTRDADVRRECFVIDLENETLSTVNERKTSYAINVRGVFYKEVVDED